jgi:hypothetical protein
MQPNRSELAMEHRTDYCGWIDPGGVILRCGAPFGGWVPGEGCSF